MNNSNFLNFLIKKKFKFINKNTFIINNQHIIVNDKINVSSNCIIININNYDINITYNNKTLKKRISNYQHVIDIINSITSIINTFDLHSLVNDNQKKTLTSSKIRNYLKEIIYQSENIVELSKKMLEK